MAITSRERLVLSVSLDTSGRQAEVCCLLKRNEERVDEWRFSAERMGLPEALDRRKALYQGYEFEIPAEVLDAMKGWMDPHRPLWLRLERPSGYLRLVPWEQLLGPRLGVPILRLPDFETEPPRESPRSLDILLCASAPEAKQSFPLVDTLDRITGRILQILAAVPRRTTLHVFVDAAAHAPLKARWEGTGKLGAAIQLYAPESAAPYGESDPASRIKDSMGRIESPWLLWMRDSLRGSRIDVAHFVCHGYLSEDRGALAFAESPLRNEDERMARFVWVAELSLFLTQIGAWSAVFSSPENNYSEMGLRLLADNLAQSRPGPVLHHELRLDPVCVALARAYQFLYGPSGAPPPASPSLLLYCQPSLLEAPVMRAATRSFAVGPEETPAQHSLRTLYETDENVPAWVAAAERSIEQVNLRLQKMAAAPGQSRGKAELDPVQETLRQIQEIVARAAVKKGEEP
ncbi:MAG TPA: hypothetical protein VF756_19850 [Thermoanaerobaculia bacterium]